MTEEQIAQLQLDYEGRIGSLLAVDDHVKKLVRTLRKTGQLKNTLIVFLSDNGWLQGQHRITGDKYLPYEESLRIPLILRGPGVPAGQHGARADLQHRLRPHARGRRERTGRAARWTACRCCRRSATRASARTGSCRSRRSTRCSGATSR